MDGSDLLINTLRQGGHRVTAQRRAICDYLAASRSHPTAYQVFSDMSAEHPEISRATVYNTLNVLKRLGAIVEVNHGDDHTHYETDLTPHINLICLRCNKITDYFRPLQVDLLEETLAEETGFQPVANKVEVYGFCQECRERKRSEIREQWRAQHETPSHGEEIE